MPLPLAGLALGPLIGDLAKKVLGGGSGGSDNSAAILAAQNQAQQSQNKLIIFAVGGLALVIAMIALFKK